MMEAFIAVSLIVLVAAITPGPNNFIVLATAMRGSRPAIFQAIALIVLGTLSLLLLVWAGAGELFRHQPLLRPLLTLLGGGYLCWMGLRLMLRASITRAAVPGDSGLPTGSGIAVFQLMNPKSWVLVLTAFSALPAGMDRGQALAGLLLVFPVITTACLGLWAAAGHMLAPWVSGGRSGLWFDRVMGLLLSLSALMLVVGSLAG